MELDSHEKIRQALYRLVGTDSSDPYLSEQGESANEVVDILLTRGCRNAQRWMLDMGYGGWRKRSDALSWSGSDSTTGGRYDDVPSDFLRAYGSQRRSALVRANGDRWGSEINPKDDDSKGDFYYIRGDEIWITRNAQPPATLYLDYHYLHPKWEGAFTIDFPMDARYLIVAEAANVGKEENWLPGGREMEQKIERALFRAREEARHIARSTKNPRQFQKLTRFGNHW
jgi:hypothetical protein